MASFSIPLSGLAATSASLNVIANNLANLNTDGYKDETLNFASVFNQMQGTSGNGDPIQYGSGVKVAGRVSNFSDGNVASTGIASNMALQGNGFFVVQNTDGSESFTRNGDFTVNAAGQLSTQGGQLVLGYPVVAGVIQSRSTLTPITVNGVNNIPANATTTFQMTTNLDATSTAGTTFDTPITVYDSLGETHVLTVEYTNTAPNTWTYSVTLPAADTGGNGAPTQLATGTLNFSSSGVLTNPVGSIPGIAIKNLADGAANMSLTWNLNGSGGVPAITQQAASSATSAWTQNGYGTGSLTGYTVSSDGTVEGQFSNMQTLALGQVAVASFANNQGLTQAADNDLQPTLASGAPLISAAGIGGNGLITGGAVEQSNVNLSAEFGNMIVAQQGYEANAKVLTTFDQVAQATLQVIS
jgi:flagellar hook protein FlgE